MDVSVVIPVKNGMPYIEQCLEALLEQDFTGNWEICVYDDASTDCTVTCVEGFIPRLRSRGVDLRLSHGLESGGVGFAKNRAVEMSCGRFICFCDADDISEPSRIQEQFAVADSQESPLVYTSHGPTLIAPTWFISRELFTKLGGFKDDVRTGFAEDLEFFYRALDLGHANKILVKYRYHPGCSSFGVSEDTIWNMRIDRFRRCVLPRWPKFTIWNAGKQGKRSLSEEDKRRVECFCDVDEKKIKRGWFEDYDEAARVESEEPAL
ncbi:glycosyltransferase, group 2 family protein [Ancylostoma ceylanicum]|uniref:Glycosyltransferase, group 2 family protein n=1 Tax=Ancylostoma ceylanicum TaxID=53326 RepID=A0A0D6LS26_9BILA|nr:glycosyltransferase, group 2 family protein [Ancylostoma ceylanicum]